MQIREKRKALSKISSAEINGQIKPDILRMYPFDDEHDENNINVYYAPFDEVNVDAKVVLIGITPGESQMRRSWRAAHAATSNGEDIASTISEFKRVSSFNDDKGQMRPNLIKQLEHWGVDKWLGLPNAESLFYDGWPNVQTTSLLCYPVFKGDDNYVGTSPNILKHSYLSTMIYKVLVSELNKIPNALLLPLGPKVESIIKHLYMKKMISNPCCYGMFAPKRK